MYQQKSSVVQSLASLLQKVQIFGQGDSPADDSLNLENDNYDDRVSSSNLPKKSATSQPIPYTPKSNYCKFQEGLLNSVGYENSLGSSTFTNSLCSHEDSSLQDNYPSYRDTEFSDDNDDVEEDEIILNEDKKDKSGQDSLPEISLSEVSQHDAFHDCWIIFYDKVYDVSSYLFKHPGGDELLMEHAGRDGTMAFRSVGHSKGALRSLQKYIIGVLPPNERIFSDWETL